MNLRLIIALLLSVCIIGCEMNEQPVEEILIKTEEAPKETIEEPVFKNLFYSGLGKFKVKFLGDPRVKLDPIQTEFGEIESMSFIYERNIIETYMVAYTDYPSMMVDASAPMALLQGAKEGSMLDGAEIDMEQEIEIKGYPGLYFKSTFDGIYSEYKLYLVENRLYQVAILRDGDYATPAESDEFFNSFQLIGLD